MLKDVSISWKSVDGWPTVAETLETRKKHNLLACPVHVLHSNLLADSCWISHTSVQVSLFHAWNVSAGPMVAEAILGMMSGGVRGA